MAKMKFFKMCVLMLCVCMIPSLAGCSLVTTNVDKQLNEVVASFDNGRVEVTREDLILTYNSIGNSNYDNSSTPTQSGVEQTLNLALNRAILVDFLTADDKQAEREKLGLDKIVLTTYEANNVWRNVYSYLNSALKNNEDQLREEAGATLEEKTTEEEKSTAYTPYDKTYTYYYDSQSGQFVLERVTEDTPYENESIALFDTSADLTFAEKAKQAMENFRSKYWEYTDSTEMDPTYESENSFSDKAWNKYINALTRAEADRNLSKEPAEIFLREVQRIYQIYYDNQILTRFQEDFEKSNDVTIDMVATKFKELYNAQYEQFTANPSAFDSLIPTSAEKVYYMQNPEGYFKVNHILIKFSDEQNDAMEAEKTKLSNGQITKTQYEANIEKIKSETKAYNRDTQEYESMDTFYSKLQSALSTATSDSTRMVVFREFMHRYSQDDATLNASACYYIPTDSTKDTMEENFANVSRELYDNGNGQVSAISNFAETSYGYHIIMYTGNATNISASGNNQTIVERLNGYYLNPLYNKTMLDQIIENITLTSYSTYENNILNQIKADKNIVIYPSSYNDLY